MMSLWFQWFLLPGVWAQRVRIDIAQGRIHAIHVNVAPDHTSECHTVGLPGLTTFIAMHFSADWQVSRNFPNRPVIVSGLGGRPCTVLSRPSAATISRHSPLSPTWRCSKRASFESANFTTCTMIAAVGGLPIPPSWPTVSRLPHMRLGIGLDAPPRLLRPFWLWRSSMPDSRQARFVNDIDSYAVLLEHTRQAVGPLDDAMSASRRTACARSRSMS